MYDYDVIIVGAGPAGAAAAIHLTNLDPAHARHSLLLDRAHFPRTKLCGGGVTLRADALLDRLGVPVSVPSVVVRQVEMVCHDHRMTFERLIPFRVVRREAIDHALLEAARRRGVATLEGAPVVDLGHEGDAVAVVTPTRRYRARLVIGADGANSVVRRKLGLARADGLMRALEVLTPPSPEGAAAGDSRR